MYSLSSQTMPTVICQQCTGNTRRYPVGEKCQEWSPWWWRDIFFHILTKYIFLWKQKKGQIRQQCVFLRLEHTRRIQIYDFFCLHEHDESSSQVGTLCQCLATVGLWTCSASGWFFWSQILDSALESGLLIRIVFWPKCLFNMFSLPHQL